MHGISFFYCYGKHHATKCSGNAPFCNDHVRITLGTSYRIRRRNVPVEYRCHYDLDFSEQCKYLYSNSDRS